MTKEQFISDVELQVYQGQISDDAELSKDQIAFWGSYNLNMLVANELNEKLKRGEFFPAVYKKRASCEVLTKEDVDCADDCGDRVFAELDEEVLSINKDAGIMRVITDEGDIVLKASVETLDFLRYMPFSKPDTENLVYIREGNKIYIEGLKPVDIPFNKINVDYVPRQNMLTMANTDTILVSDMVLPQVIDLTVQRAKMELYGSQADKENDGVDYKDTVYHTAIANPVNNEPQ